VFTSEKSKVQLCCLLYASSIDQIIANLVSGHCSCAIAPRGEARAHVHSRAEEDERPRHGRAEEEGDDREEPAGVASHLPGRRHALGRPWRRGGRDAAERVVRVERHGAVFIWRQAGSCRVGIPSLYCCTLHIALEK